MCVRCRKKKPDRFTTYLYIYKFVFLNEYSKFNYEERFFFADETHTFIIIYFCV